MASEGQKKANRSKTGTYTSNAGKTYYANNGGGSSGSNNNSGSGSSPAPLYGDALNLSKFIQAIGKTQEEAEAVVRTGLASPTGSGGSSGSNNKPAPVTTPKPALTYAPGSLETMTVAQAKAAGRYDEYMGIVNSYKPGAATTSAEIRKVEEIAEKKDEPFEIPETLTYEDYKSKFEPKITKPETPKYEDKYVKLREQQGIEALEDSIGKYDEDAALLEENLRKFKQKEMSGQALGFAQGRISVEQQGIQDQLDFIARQQNAAINKVNTKNKFIETMMGFAKLDYETANDQYQFEFNKNLTMQQMYSTEKNQIRDDARATLTTISNMVANSGKSYDELDTDMQNKVNVLELQAGYPVGTFEKYAVAKPKANIISTSQGTDASGNDFISFISVDPATGEKSIERMYTGGKSRGGGNLTEAEQKQQDAQTVLSQMKSKAGSDGYVSPSDWKIAKNRWQVVYPDDDFDTRFNILKNPDNPNYD